MAEEEAKKEGPEKKPRAKEGGMLVERKPKVRVHIKPKKMREPEPIEDDLPKVKLWVTEMRYQEPLNDLKWEDFAEAVQQAKQETKVYFHRRQGFNMFEEREVIAYVFGEKEKNKAKDLKEKIIQEFDPEEGVNPDQCIKIVKCQAEANLYGKKDICIKTSGSFQHWNRQVAQTVVSLDYLVSNVKTQTNANSQRESISSQTTRWLMLYPTRQKTSKGSWKT
jgi:hypothetical protein